MHPTLIEIYESLNKSFKDVFVVPLIPFSQKKTSYLYTLYKDLINNPLYTIYSTSFIAHWRFVFAQLMRKQPILHYHWVEFQDLKALAGMPYKLLCISLYKALGGQLVWTVHNKIPHDGKFVNMHRVLSKWMAKQADVILSHCNQEKKDLMAYQGQSHLKYKIVPHPLFDVDTTISKKYALNQIEEIYDIELSPKEYLFLVFGQISHYKQIDGILNAFTQIKEPSRIIVAGVIKKGNQHVYKQLLEQQNKDDRISIIASHIPEEHVEWLHIAADSCVFNHINISTSGAIMMAKSFNKTIIAPHTGCITEDSSENINTFSSREELFNLMHKYASLSGD